MIQNNLYRVYTYRNGKPNQCFINAKTQQDAKEKTWWLPQDDTENGKQAIKVLKPSKVAIEKAYALEEYHKVFTRYINGKSNIIKEYMYLPCKGFERSIDIIVNLRKDGYKVKCGYTCTSIRGVHEHLIFYKK